MLDAQRRLNTPAGAIVLAVVAQHVAGELIFAPRFASPDAREVVRAYFAAR